MRLKKQIGWALILSLILSLFSGITAYAAEPAADVSDYRGLVISRVFGSGGNNDGVTEYSFFELCNTSDAPMDLGGLALYYKTSGDAAYQTYEFEPFIMEPGSYYLIRCAGPTEKYKVKNEIIRLTDYDAVWDVEVSNEEISLVLACAGRTLDADISAAEISDKISYFCATKAYYFDTGYVDDLSKKKYAVRTALQEDSGWELVNLTKANSAKLEQILPVSSSGIAGRVVKCAIDEVKFSHAAGFYAQPIGLSMTAPEGYAIYYTLDGSDPTVSGTARPYTGELWLSDTSHLGAGATTNYVTALMGRNYAPADAQLPGAHVVKAYATDGVNSTDIFTNTYFVSEDMDDYGVTVMSVSMDKTDFAGNNGFYNRYYTTTNDSNPRSLGTIEVFDREGGRQGCSNVELAVSGHASANYPMKSMKVYYKKDFNGSGGRDNKLYYDLFDGHAKNDKGQTITTFSRLLLRNSGNDFYESMLRDGYEQRVSSELEVDTAACAPILVFVNGEFWGCYNARERYCEEYVEAHYGVDKDNVALIENDYTKVRTDTNAPLIVNDGEPGDEDSFNALVQFVKTHDMSLAGNFDYVASQIDLESFMDMYIAHLYLNAIDWPENNIKVWRNKAGAEDPSGVDDKWHFTLHDMDFGVWFYDQDGPTPAAPTPTGPRADYFGAINAQYCAVGNLMNRLIRNAAFKEAFLARFYQAIREIYTPEKLTAALDEFTSARTPLMALQVGRWGNERGVSMDAYRNSIAKMRRFAESRQVYALRQLCSYFGVSEDELKALCGLGGEAPSVNPGYTFRNASYDTLYVNGIAANSGGNASVWFDANLPTRTIERTFNVFKTIGFKGWIGFEEEIQAFGYQINDEEPVWGDFAVATEDAVKWDVFGGKNAMRFYIEVPVKELSGVNTIVAVVRVNGKTVKIDGSLVNVSLPSPDTTVTYINQFEPVSETCYDGIFVNNRSVVSPGGSLNPAKLHLEGDVNHWLTLSGWHANNAGIERFGCRLDGGAIVYSDSFRTPTAQAVLDAGIAAVGPHASTSRFKLSFPIQRGDHTIEVFCDTGGEELLIWTVEYSTDPVIIPPAPPEEPVEPVLPDDPEPEEPAEPVTLVGASFDSFYQNDVLSPLHCGVDGGASEVLDKVGRTLTDLDGSVSTIGLRGWIGFSEEIHAFGYRINDDEPVYGSFAENTESVVRLDQHGGPKAQRFKITVPVAGLTGSNRITAVVRLADGAVIELDGSTLENNAKALPDVSVTYQGAADIRQHTSRDQLKVNGRDVGSYGNNPNFTLLNLSGRAGQMLEVFGWNSNSSGILCFGYRLDGGSTVYNTAFRAYTEPIVHQVGASLTGPTGEASRMKVLVPIVSGRHVVEVVCHTGSEELVIWTVSYKA